MKDGNGKIVVRNWHRPASDGGDGRQELTAVFSLVYASYQRLSSKGQRECQTCMKEMGPVSSNRMFWTLLYF